MQPKSTLISLLLLAAASQLLAQPAVLPHPGHLRAAAARVDITPPEGTPVVGHIRPVSGVRDPLSAVLLLLDDSRTRAAIITLDLINAGGDMAPRLKQAISEAADVPAENIMVATSHNHSGPGWSEAA